MIRAAVDGGRPSTRRVPGSKRLAPGRDPGRSAAGLTATTDSGGAAERGPVRRRPRRRAVPPGRALAGGGGVRRRARSLDSIRGRTSRRRDPVERHLDASVAVGPEHPRSACRDRRERRRGRVTVRVPGAGGGDGDLRPHGVEERARRRRPAAVMGDLEQVDAGQPARHEGRVDSLLDVAGEQEALPADLAEQDDRHVVDGRSRRRPAGAARHRGPATAPGTGSRRGRTGRPSRARRGSEPEPGEGRLARPGSPGPVRSSRARTSGPPGSGRAAAPARRRGPRGDGSGRAGRSGDPMAAGGHRGRRAGGPGRDRRRRGAARRGRPRRGSRHPGRRRGRSPGPARPAGSPRRRGRRPSAAARRAAARIAAPARDARRSPGRPRRSASAGPGSRAAPGRRIGARRNRSHPRMARRHATVGGKHDQDARQAPGARWTRVAGRSRLANGSAAAEPDDPRPGREDEPGRQAAQRSRPRRARRAREPAAGQGQRRRRP